jgi:hypothetical protein
VRCARLAPGALGAPGVQDATDRLWYPLHDPPKLGLPQPIVRLIERLVKSASPP